jgi:hypothetical protein
MTPRHHTKDKGDLAVAKVQAHLIERGASVLLPLIEHAPFDLVAYADETFYLIQVKYRAAVKGAVVLHFRSTWVDRHGSHVTPMSREEVDIVAIYCPGTGATYYLNPADFRASLALRIEPPRNGQARGILMATDFLLMPPPTATGVRPRGGSSP